MKEHGFIKLDRCIEDNRWYKVPNTCHLYIYLLMNANFKKGKFELHTIERGQLVTSLKHLSYNTGLSVQEVRTALKHLKSTHDITIETTTKYSIITVNNYEKFAASTHVSTSNQQTTHTQTTCEQQQYNKNNKKNNSKKGINNCSNEGKSFYEIMFEKKSLFND